MRGSVGGFLENVREIVFVDEKRVRNRVEGQIIVDIFGYIVDCSAYASVGRAVGKVLLVVLQKELRKGDEQSFYAFLIFDIRAEIVLF